MSNHEHDDFDTIVVDPPAFAKNRPSLPAAIRGYHDIKRYPAARLIPGLVLFRWDAPLFFANAELFNASVLEAVAQSPTPVRRIVVSAEPVTSVDVTSADVLAELAQRHPQLHVHTVYSDRFVDLIAEGFDCAIRLGYLQDSSLLARRVGPIHGALVASPDYIEAHGAPETLPELLAHEAVMQGTESWRLMDGEQVVSVHPRGRFKADNGREPTADEYDKIRAWTLSTVRGTVPADGGYAVPQEIDAMIAAQLKAISPIRALAQVVQTGTAGYRKLVTTGGTPSGWASEITGT